MSKESNDFYTKGPPAFWRENKIVEKAVLWSSSSTGPPGSRVAPIEEFTDIPITDIVSRIEADTDNR